MGAPLLSPQPALLTLREPGLPTVRGERLAILDACKAQMPVDDASALRSARMYQQGLELLATGASLNEILLHLAREIQDQTPGSRVAIMLLDEGGERLHLGVAPDLDPQIVKVIETTPLGPDAVACARAAYFGLRASVPDVAQDPLPDELRALAQRCGVQACWVEPIIGNGGKILGAIGNFHTEPGEPTAGELDTVAIAARLARIAIERKGSEDRIARLANLYHARSEISQHVVHASDEDELLQSVCRVAVRLGGMRLAWIGAAKPDSDMVCVLASEGESQQYLEGFQASVRGDVPLGQGPVGQTYRSGEYVVVNNVAGSSFMRPWRDRAEANDIRSSASVAIRRGGKPFGVLSVYNHNVDAFDDEAVELLRQIGRDVGFALDGFDRARERTEAIDALDRSEKHFRAYFEHSLVGMASTDSQRRWIEANETFCQMLGYSREELMRTSWEKLTHPDDMVESEIMYKSLVNGRTEQFDLEKRYVRKDGSVIQVRIAGRPVWDADGKFEYIALVVKDITEGTQTAKALAEKSEFLNSILESEPECVKVVNLDGALVQMNAAGLAMLGVDSFEEVRSMGLMHFVLPKYRKPFRDLHRRVCEGGSGVLEFQMRSADGAVHWMETHAAPLRDTNGNVHAVLGITRDISEKKRSAEVIWRQANFDMLTGLPNRYMLQDRVGQEIKKSRRGASKVALLFIDLDHFKEINDTLGHESGDAILVQVAHRLRACVRDTDTVARLGGDEFTVVLPQISQREDAERVAQTVLACLAGSYEVGKETVALSASIGITYYPDDASSVDELLRCADQAMYVSKRLGRNRVACFTPVLQQDAQHRMRMSNDLRSALAAHEFRVMFQPIVELASRRVAGAEALLRWHHPTRGLIPPGEFIPLAEETGLIVDIGDWVFREAAMWAHRWNTRRANRVHVAVNVSPVQFRNPGKIVSWLDYLDALGLAGGAMTIEITEGLLLSADAQTSTILKRLHEHGLHVSIDDFGTGYSALSYLHKFDIHTLKIDQSFVRDLQSSRGAQALTESIIVMAHKLGLTVVAEGVETEQQREFLLAAGCDLAQGYLFAKPVTPEQFNEFLEAECPTLADESDIDW
jgi:diguanylate cyclase (GGDEF)-like protein/PAS domain S-box-containing protein